MVRPRGFEPLAFGFVVRGRLVAGPLAFPSAYAEPRDFTARISPTVTRLSKTLVLLGDWNRGS